MLKRSLYWLLTLVYRVEVQGLAHYQQAGTRVLIIANHTSFLDPLLLGVFLPDAISFAINSHIAKRWWLKPFLRLSTVFAIDPSQPLSLKALITHLQNNHKTVIFPEGRITTTGALMKIYDGTGMVAEKSGATLLPIYIDGAQYSPFSKMQGLLRLRPFPKITLHIQAPVRLDTHQGDSGKQRRKASGHRLADIMTQTMFASSAYRQSIFKRLLQARSLHGGKHTVVEDLARTPLSYDTLVTRSIVLANALQAYTQVGENVGVLLPNSSNTLLVVLALQYKQRVPAMLNFATGGAAMLSACQVARIHTVLTARKFIDLAQLHGDVALLSGQVQYIYLEDIAAQLSKSAKIIGWLQSKTCGWWYADPQSPDSPAVVLFTSGSEGTPKGVVLSHANILANHAQVAARIAFTPQDVVLNFLPMFHSFGFTVATLLPVLHGMTTFLYPTPLHFSVIPEIAYEINATILFGTNTFFAAYGKKAHAYDFYSVRYAVAGAEKLQDATRTLWAEKFGIRLLEGYGATETAPVAAVNTPMDYKAGTVGRLMPAMDYRLEPVDGIAQGGRLHLKGPNIMLGYLLADSDTGELLATQSIYGKGWYDTGDIVTIDEDGFVRICGRSKRFAKVGAEMVSLTVVESLASRAWPDSLHGAVSIADAKKGEQIVLVTTEKNATLSQLNAIASGVAAIALPKKILYSPSIPVLATGKTDYNTLTEWAAAQLSG